MKLKTTIPYQGLHKNNYFEGWYYKCVTQDQKQSIVFIPGISKNKTDPHAFIQVIYHNDTTFTNTYMRFDSNQFQSDSKKLLITLASSIFKEDSLNLNLEHQDMHVQGQLDILSFKDIKRSIVSPTIMGPFAYLPFMACNHEVINMHGTLKGHLSINGQFISFDGGNVYIEKDYGTSFPDAYLWIQANHFSNPKHALFFSYATIPYLGLSFKGLICVLLIQDKEYRFATYNGTKTTYQVEGAFVSIKLKKGQYSLEITAKAHDVMRLKSPVKGMMQEEIKEGVTGEVFFKLYKDKKLIASDQSSNAGIEIMMK